MSLGRNLYLRGSDVITVISEDCTGRKNGKMKANANDDEEIARIFQSMIDKYGLNLKIIKEQNLINKTWLDDDVNLEW